MHELAVTKSIVDVVARNAVTQGAHRVVRVRLVVGRMRNFEREWVQRYFDRFAKGTVAEGARLDIDYVPIVFYCNSCGATFQLEMATGQRMRCSECGSEDYNMITGGELLIKEMEIA
jgi:hydrogenase nickel incorporation protein HypA/HybF